MYELGVRVWESLCCEDCGGMARARRKDDGVVGRWAFLMGRLASYRL
jgi:hypothetical protein